MDHGQELRDGPPDNLYADALENRGPPGDTGGGAVGEGLQEEGGAQIDDFLGANQDYNEEEEEKKYFRRKRLGVIKNVLAVSVGGTLTYGVYLGLLQMQLILHYDETYREVKYGNMGLQDIDRKMLMGINVTPIVALLYTPVLIRFLGVKWMIFLATGIYSLFVSTNYWERYYTLVPSAVAIGVAIVPLWTAMGNYITRPQQYYEFVHFKEDQVQEQKKLPKGACRRYIIIFQSVFYFFFNLSFVCAQMPMIFFLNPYFYPFNHTLYGVKQCGQFTFKNYIVLHCLSLSPLPLSSLLALLGILYEDKERQDFVFTVYHWWQAMAIFVVYLWEGLPFTSMGWGGCWSGGGVGGWRGEGQVKGYRYLEEENSDESDCEGKEEEEEEEEEEPVIALMLVDYFLLSPPSPSSALLLLSPSFS
ncbi:protein unc-93 homolog B1 [Polyodon spathula]|uniref:protein unc-93 homolog B1 n=1 Tax=Polyodon spathula TaxID=7913 RepID=UPI001B7EBF87|nr:protein unc-93 homolog B1 [Polyodon spathula]